MPSSSADAIAQNLNEQFQADNVFFQIVEHNQVLHIYLNHQPGDQPDYARLTEGIQQVVASHFSGPADGFWLYSRELGNTDPSWQTYIQIPRHAYAQTSNSEGQTDASNGSVDSEPSLDDSSGEMVQLTGTTAEMQKVIGFSGVSQDDANAATEILGSNTTDSNRSAGEYSSSDDGQLEEPQFDGHHDDDFPTEAVPLGGQAMGAPVAHGELDDSAETEMVPLGGVPADGTGGGLGEDDAATEFARPLGHAGLAQEDVGELTDEPATEMAPLNQNNVLEGQSPLSSQESGDAWDDEESATEMHPLKTGADLLNRLNGNDDADEESPTVMVPLSGGVGNPSPVSGTQSARKFDEESATEMVPMAAGMKVSSMAGQSGAIDEESATEMVPLSGAAPLARAAQQMNGSVDEESATEMVPLTGAPSLRTTQQTSSSSVDEESATEMVPLSGNGGSVLSAFAAQRSVAAVDEESVTEMVSLGGTSGRKVPLSGDEIALALDRNFQPERLRFQVTQRDGQWHVCANHSADVEFDFDSVGDRVRAQLQLLIGADSDSFWFYSRAVGQKATQHKALLQLAGHVAVDSPAEVDAHSATPSDLPPVGVESVFADSASEMPASGQINSGMASNGPLDLSQYCFVRNRLLLQGKLLPPSQEVARLLKTFHTLSDNEKKEAIEGVERIFNGQKPQSDSFAWLEELNGLSDSDLRKAAIWFSRYCEQPGDTISQINEILNGPKAAATPSPPSSPASNNSGLPSYGGRTYQSPYSPEAYQPEAELGDRPGPVESVQYPKWLRFVLPLAWCIYMALVVTFGSSHQIYSFDLPACQSLASPQSCELAALVATPEAVESMATSAPYTPTYEEETTMVNACEEHASLYTGNFNTSITSTLSSVSETLPGVYLVDIQYPDPNNSSGPMARTACVASLEGWGADFDDFDAGDLEGFDEEFPSEWADAFSGPQILAADSIPLNWPATPYEGNSFINVINQVGLLVNPFFWAGINVFLAAVGLLLMNATKMGVAAGSIESILIVALGYGVLDSVLVSAFNFIPFFSLLTSPFRRFAILSVASSLFKDFWLDRNNLLKLVLGMLLLFFIQFIGKFAIALLMGMSLAISAFT